MGRAVVSRPAVVAVLAAGLTTMGITSSAASPGPGTWSSITSPTSIIYHYNATSGASNPLTVSGRASSDLTSVDIDCINAGSDGPQVLDTLATSVPVSGGQFSVVGTLRNTPVSCRLRALPAGTSVSDDVYLGSFAGPILYANTFVAQKDTGGHVFTWAAIGEQGDGIIEQTDAGTCGTGAIATIETPAMEVRGSPGNGQCTLGLPYRNLTATGVSSSSSITVSGHNAYLPSGVHTYLIGDLGLPVTQTSITTSFTRSANGDLRITESAPLVRCSVGDTYPPTTSSCPALVPTGVTFSGVVDLFRGSHQARVRDTFSSTDHASHAVSLQYVNSVSLPSTGAPGFALPGHGYSRITTAKTVTLPSAKAGTLLIRSDIYGSSDDPQVDTHAVSWSRAPSAIRFLANGGAFSLAYSLTAAPNRPAFLGFATSEHLSTSATAALAAVATEEMVNAPSISSPKSGATVRGTHVTVRGSLTVGANGVPNSVTVNGHAAKVVRTGATTATYSVTLTESYARHTLVVTATDTAGNTASRSVSVTTRK